MRDKGSRRSHLDGGHKFYRAQRAGLVLQPGVPPAKLSRLGLGLGARALGTKNLLQVGQTERDLSTLPRGGQ